MLAGPQTHERIQPLVVRLDRPNRRLDNLDRRQFAVPHPVRQLRGRHIRELT